MDYKTLWLIFGYIDTHWQTNSGMQENQFELAVNGLMEIDSNYRSYYQQTLTEYERLLNHTGDQQKALELLYTSNTTSNPQNPNIATALQGFMNWNVAFGGFQSYSYENYPGWMGGGSFTDTPPPYRTINNTQGEKS